jgi:hypothetical protein
MSTFRLFLLEMVRQGGCHAVTLFLFELHLLFEKVRAKKKKRISFFFPPSSSPRLTSGSSEGGPEGSDFEGTVKDDSV